MAGLVWRYRDADNYYLARLNLREQDVRIYRVVAGNRTRLEDEDNLELDPGACHVLKIERRGLRMRVWINGVPVGDARAAGGAGLGLAISKWIAETHGGRIHCESNDRGARFTVELPASQPRHRLQKNNQAFQ